MSQQKTPSKIKEFIKCTSGMQGVVGTKGHGHEISDCSEELLIGLRIHWCEEVQDSQMLAEKIAEGSTCLEGHVGWRC